ncbi:hypothetical protein B9Z55_006507 [Caenorhabditis nigoni]|uniref:Uncharacterized protein n=1 Tax=Caenorhabditis nigoni TaxID=1611254 RepID=A0A2G5V5F3_9PELO|nr:hypothetical protein B9Z55_006507 [Caenorhabditis nigoni]
MPKGGASSLTPVYAGLREDLDSFLKAYLQVESIRFSDYKKLFEHRGMVYLLNGRDNSAEIIEFNECLLVHCLPYMEEFVCSDVPRSLKERLFGLYSLHTFFYIQPESHVVKVRMDPDTSRNFRKLAELLLRERILDAYMICLKLLEDKAIRHVAFITIHDPAHFKRFNTDDKVAGVKVLTNLNDPMSNIKALMESDSFQKLELVHSQYTNLKKRIGFTGGQVTDIGENVRESMDQRLGEMSTNYCGVNEIISTDHSSEQLASRGMLRSSTKEQAYSAELKLTRFRRHRTTAPLQISTDSFEFNQNTLEEDVKNIKNIEKVEEYIPSEPVHRRKRKIKNSPVHKTNVVEEPSSPEQKVAKRKLRSQNNTSDKSNADISSHISPGQLSEAEHFESTLLIAKEGGVGLNLIEAKVKKEPEVREYRRTLRSSRKLVTPDITPNSSPTGTEDIKTDECIESFHSPTPKPIIKSTKDVKLKSDRKVVFRENKEGQLHTIIHTISRESSYETVPEVEKKVKHETKPTSILQMDSPRRTSNQQETVFDDTDMFQPIYREDLDDDDDGINDDLSDILLSDDDLMIIDDVM